MKHLNLKVMSEVTYTLIKQYGGALAPHIFSLEWKQ